MLYSARMGRSSILPESCCGQCCRKRSTRWHADNLPCPSVATIARAIQIKLRTVQKRVSALQAVGLLTRTERRKTPFDSDTNLYSFEGLIEAALPFANEKVEERAKRVEAEKDRIARKKPQPSW